jgi:hypothetical protein
MIRHPSRLSQIDVGTRRGFDLLSYLCQIANHNFNRLKLCLTLVSSTRVKRWQSSKEVHASRQSYTPGDHLTADLRKQNGGWRRATVTWAKPLCAARKSFPARAKLHTLELGQRPRGNCGPRKSQLPQHRKATSSRLWNGCATSVHTANRKIVHTQPANCSTTDLLVHCSENSKI